MGLVGNPVTAYLLHATTGPSWRDETLVRGVLVNG